MPETIGGAGPRGNHAKIEAEPTEVGSLPYSLNVVFAKRLSTSIRHGVKPCSYE